MAVTFIKAASIGVRLVRAIALGANTVEGVQGTAKGAEKRDLALRIAQEALSFCQENQALPMTPKVREKLQKLNDAYVDAQNAIAEAMGAQS